MSMESQYDTPCKFTQAAGLEFDDGGSSDDADRVGSNTEIAISEVLGELHASSCGSEDVVLTFNNLQLLSFKNIMSMESQYDTPRKFTQAAGLEFDDGGPSDDADRVGSNIEISISEVLGECLHRHVAAKM
ncbi:hypothetical protein L6452_31785 [Arctium lappa]|uniref:Uncharacterized protein n=1 Tax=Arctium lappa TaxID=4217 RepID=A0ACB8Z3D7_ARCLA|nr:hypothetical protein L6452_31785 [Arctium lappa]